MNNIKIGVIDYGIGNVSSICNIIQKVGSEVKVLSSPEMIENVTAIILPGVGSFDKAMCKLEEGGWIEPLYKHAVVNNKFFLGICLGMQLLTKNSQEGKEKGLGFVDAETVSFDINKMTNEKKIPHMGWNVVNVKNNNTLFALDEPEKRFYFAHSYHVVCNNKKDILLTTDYGYSFTSSFRVGNIIGVQFHPEKSHHFGYQFFERMINEVSG